MAVRIFNEAADDDATTIFRRIDMCCNAVMAAAAQDTAEGAVMTAPGGAAGDLQWNWRWCNRMISVKLQVDSNDDIQRIDVCSCMGAAAAQDIVEGAVAMAAGGDS